MRTLRWVVSLITLLFTTAQAQFAQPYQWSTSVQGAQLTVAVDIPETAYLYADRTTVNLSPAAELQQTPVSHSHTDDFGTADIYEGGQTHQWVYQIDPSKPHGIVVNYQGCGEPAGGGGAVCYPPATETLDVGQASGIPEPVENTGSLSTEKPVLQSREAKSLDALLDQFETVRSDGGMKNAADFLAFLAVDEAEGSSAGFLEGKNVLLMILLVLLGGLALNLTPCVLPMIPVNLAIIGAGAEAATKRQGFIRGGVYGLGIALSYGSLGLFTLLTGSKFGTLNASPTFNLIIAGVFAVLALALFDVLNIDLSRYGSKFGVSSEKKGRLLPAFAMGVVAALLAGACVAPIVIAVLLQATAMVAGGNPLGFLLPLLLGVGMALPWPIAGAGMTVLPKPGMWMVRIKHGFGILIILFAAYYAYLGVKLLPKTSEAGTTETEIVKLEAGLQEALENDQPVFIDFWASWCKNCLQMKKTTFKDPAVVERLRDFKDIRFQAEDIGDPRITKLLDRYELPGLPGYVILKPKPGGGR